MKELTKEYISDLIEQSGMTKVEFAAKMGYSQRQYLDSVLNNKKKDVYTVVKMAEILNIPLMEFIGLEEPPKTVFGCLYVHGKPHIVKNKKEIQDLLNDVVEPS